jgi:hypothetical protein
MGYTWEGFMKYAVDTGSGAMIYRPSFIKTGSGCSYSAVGFLFDGNN